MNVVLMIRFKLKKGADIKEFLAASKELNDKYMSKQKGYISWQQLNDNDTWIDYLTFDTMEDAKAVEQNQTPCQEALKFYSYLNCNSCKVEYFYIEKSYS